MNDNQPQLRDFVVYVVSHEDRLASGNIGIIPALWDWIGRILQSGNHFSDSDQSASLEYSLADNELLGVERTTGKLFLKTIWRSSFDASLDSCVTGTRKGLDLWLYPSPLSDGPNTVCVKCRLVYVYVKSEWLSEAVTVRLEGTNEDSFWDPAVFNRFRYSTVFILYSLPFPDNRSLLFPIGMNLIFFLSPFTNLVNLNWTFPS